jgi:hypothetical protein
MSYFGPLTFGESIAQGKYSNFAKWSKIGFTPTMTTAESDIWSKAGAYAFPSAAMTAEVVSSSATLDIAAAIRGTLPATPLTCDVGGTTTRLVDVSQDFNAATAVAVGDIVIVDPYETATTPEWGYVTAIDAGGDYLDLAGGLSSGGSFATARKYFVLDASAAGSTGAQAVKVEYLNTAYQEKTEIITLNGTTPVHAQNTDYFRINSFRVIATGTGMKAAGNLSLMDSGAAATYSYITAGYTRARNVIYTVPAGKTLWVSQANLGYAWIDAAKAQNQYCRMSIKANREPSTTFLTGSLFYPYTEIVVAAETNVIPLDEPLKFLQYTDVRISGIATAAGVATAALRGYLQTN